MSHSLHKCTTPDCKERTTGNYCWACDKKRRQKPLNPCISCGTPLHRRSTPVEQRVPGSRWYGAKGRCTVCHKTAKREGTVTTRKKPQTISVVPTPRIIVGAHLTVDERLDALCAQVDSELFFPDKGQSSAPAKRICAQCPIRMRCLEVALINRESVGIFGGTSPRERAQIRAKKLRTGEEVA